MSNLNDFIARIFVRNHERTEDVRVRQGYVRLECWTSIVGNILLGTMKLAMGFLTGSIALAADAVHTYGDMLSSVVLLVSMRVASRPADVKHPHGHGRAEPIGTLLLAAMLMMAAFEFAHTSVRQLLSPNPKLGTLPLRTELIIIAALVGFWGAKEWMARFSAHLGKKIASAALAADAQHHRSDALATFLVITSLVSARLGYPQADGFFGLAVAGFIGWTGVDFARRMMSELMGEAPSQSLVSAIHSAASSVRGVCGVRNVTVHDYGAHKVASLQIEVPGELGTTESHLLATLVEESIFRRLGLSSVVHVEVRDSQTAAADSGKRVEQTLRALVQREPSVVDFHAVHVFTSNRALTVDLHLTVKSGLPIEESHRIEHELADRLYQELGPVAVNVHCEPAKI
ncbi:MAG: cation-efflux pump [Kiritimatiellae bacterium]|nr:cation-efflux pump [Kiritimatiellia bacterium]